MSILKCSHVACQIQEMACVMSIVFFCMSIGSMLHVDFKKWPCRLVEFKGQGPSVCPTAHLLYMMVGTLYHCENRGRSP